MSPEPTIRRILVALDASPASSAATEAAAELAARLEAELLGLFVEDIGLLHAAGLPIDAETGWFSQRARRPVPEEVERQYRALARRVQEDFERAARRAAVRSSFRVVRGRVATEVAAAADEVDLVSLGRGGWLAYRRLGSTARRLLAHGHGHLLLLPHHRRLAPPVVCVVDGSPEASAALDAAAHLASADPHHPLVVLLAPDGPGDLRQLEEECRRSLGEQGLESRFRTLPPADGAALLAILEEEKAGVLVLPAAARFLAGGDLLGFLERLDRPVLLVR